MAARPGVHTQPGPATRYPAAVAHRSRELAAGGWSLARIQALLEREGCTPPPAINTIWSWTRPEAAARRQDARNARVRLARLPNATLRWPGVRGAAWRRARMLRLREIGLSNRAISKVMTHDFPDTPVTPHDVARLLDPAATVLHVHETEKAAA